MRLKKNRPRVRTVLSATAGLWYPRPPTERVRTTSNCADAIGQRRRLSINCHRFRTYRHRSSVNRCRFTESCHRKIWAVLREGNQDKCSFPKERWALIDLRGLHGSTDSGRLDSVNSGWRWPQRYPHSA